MKRIVVIGGGFAGVRAAQAAAATAFAAQGQLHVTLVSQDCQFTVRPRLYLPDPDQWQVPLARSLEPLGVELVIGEATAVELEANLVTVSGHLLPYDALVVATGSRLAWPQIPALAEMAHDIDTADGAARLDACLRSLRRSDFTKPLVVVGGGFTGIEIATELRSTIASTHGDAIAAGARIVLVDRNPDAPAMGEEIARNIRNALKSKKVEARFGRSVVEARGRNLLLDNGEWLNAAIVIYSGGLAARPSLLPERFPRDRLGRLAVDRYLRADGRSDIFAAGDAAAAAVDDTGRITLMSCQHAIPMGECAGRNAAASLLGRALQRYSQAEYVTCLDLGEADAVFTIGWDRQPIAQGDAAKRIKRTINGMIAPLSGTREAIIAALDRQFSTEGDLGKRLIGISSDEPARN